MNKLKRSFYSAGKSFLKVLPVIFGVLLLVSLINALIPEEFYKTVFQQNLILDVFIGSIAGSISVGNPMVSYVLGGEFLKQGIGLLAVTAFIVAWVTVGVAQLPIEAKLFGKKFAILRDVLTFIFSIIIALLTVFLMEVI
ncbi:MAG: hypothetical protein ACOC1P_04980 [Minisyncoccales bacterium]